MKRLMIILVVVFFSSATVTASNNLGVKIPAKISNIVQTKSAFNFDINSAFQLQVVTTFTDGCGITWTVTTTCSSCSLGDAYAAQGAWIQSHTDNQGCLHPNYTEV